MSRSRVVMISGLLALVAVATPAWADLKIGVVNYELLLQSSPQALAAQAELKKEFEPRQIALQRRQTALRAKAAEFQKNQATMSADQRATEQQQLQGENRDLSQQTSDYQDDIKARQNQVITDLQKKLILQVQLYAAKQKFDLVLASGVIFASPAVDITQKVVSLLQAQAHDPSVAPTRGSSRRGGGASH